MKQLTSAGFNFVEIESAERYWELDCLFKVEFHDCVVVAFNANGQVFKEFETI
jgi:hypothetical protein